MKFRNSLITIIIPFFFPIEFVFIIKEKTCVMTKINSKYFFSFLLILCSLLEQLYLKNVFLITGLLIYNFYRY